MFVEAIRGRAVLVHSLDERTAFCNDGIAGSAPLASRPPRQCFRCRTRRRICAARTVALSISRTSMGASFPAGTF